jgi:hypothetical protein
MRILSLSSVVVVFAAVASLMATPAAATPKKAKNIIPAVSLQQAQSSWFKVSLGSQGFAYGLQILLELSIPKENIPEIASHLCYLLFA